MSAGTDRCRGGWLGRALRCGALLVLLVAGCDPAPSGPGSLTGSIQGPDGAPGAALLLVTGEGIRGFAPSGSSRVFHARAGEALHTYRVFVVNPGEGPLEFEVEVDDLGGVRPSARILEVADREDVRLPRDAMERHSVRFAR